MHFAIMTTWTSTCTLVSTYFAAGSGVDWKEGAG
jgi:hypothetical protein